MTSIYKLKQSEYRTGARLAFENFEDLLVLSEKAAQIENYGAATSLSILALEELTKSVILQLKSINNLIPIKDLEKYFTNHEKKQNAGIEMYVALQKEYKDDIEDLSIIDDSNLCFVAIALIALLLIFYYSKESELNKKKNKSELDTIKESGFYVGYDESTRLWKSPRSEHTLQSYKGLFQYISEFGQKMRNWIFRDNLNKESILSFLHSLNDSIIDKNQLDKIK